MWEKMEIAQPLQEAIARTPSYEKFLKDTLIKKEKLEEEPVILTTECGVVLQQSLPAKMVDPGSFSIPCLLGIVFIPSALCDLGTSVSLLPKTTYDKLNVGELKPTKIILQVADKSVKDFRGLILGRLFLNTFDAVIHVRKRCIELHIGDEDIEFKLEPKPERGKEEDVHSLAIPVPGSLEKQIPQMKDKGKGIATS
ncbi:PREDICTED: uncharacterized protein LOC104806055 [Tarenaya hassleriana]|uniref:uncharacterized protein LOC104806055 n=1 Tax=Tarenaya hassleriana TaxID=28532 RepID=UPI00053C0CE2|nr:PREDICTED: uncharacterized protein LOC104806055 [Tarenaya hassleriana]